MARYEAQTKMWLNFPNGPRLVKEGEKFSYDGWPSAAMTPIDQDAKDACALLETARKQGKLAKTPIAYTAGLKAKKTEPAAPAVKAG